MARFGALAFRLAHDPSPPCENGGLCAIHQVQLAQDVPDMPFHRTRLTWTPYVQRSTKLPARMVSDDDVVEPAVFDHPAVDVVRATRPARPWSGVLAAVGH